MLHSDMDLGWSSAIPASMATAGGSDFSVDESSSQAEYVIRTNFAALYRELNEPIRTGSSNLRQQAVRMPPHHHHYHHHHRHVLPAHPPMTPSHADASYQQVQPPHPHHPLSLPLSPHPHDYEAHRLGCVSAHLHIGVSGNQQVGQSVPLVTANQALLICMWFPGDIRFGGFFVKTGSDWLPAIPPFSPPGHPPATLRLPLGYPSATPRPPARRLTRMKLSICFDWLHSVAGAADRWLQHGPISFFSLFFFYLHFLLPRVLI